MLLPMPIAKQAQRIESRNIFDSPLLLCIRLKGILVKKSECRQNTKIGTKIKWEIEIQ